MESTQELFKTLLKNIVAPQLRKIGFKGSGQNYHIPSESHWLLLSFQKSTFSDSSNLSFTVNLYAITKKEWHKAHSTHSYFPSKPTATTFWGVGWQKRIGRLLPENHDHWWTLTLNTDVQSVSKDVVATIEKYALPAIQEQLKASHNSL